MNLLNGLLSYYPLVANGSDILRGNNLTNVNGVTFSGGAANFLASSSQCLQAASGSVLDFTTGSMSVSFWFKSTANNQMLITKGTSSDAGYQIYLQSNGLLRWQPVDTAINFPTSTSNSAVNDGASHHAVCVIDRIAQLLLVYIDGVLQTSQISIATLGSITIPGHKMAIGQFSDFNSLYLTGAVKQVGFWSRALTQAEVTSLFSGGTPLSFSQFGQPQFLLSMI